MQSKSSIHYIGTNDDNLDLFEGQYPIPNGISYNSYFIADAHPAIIDAVDIRRQDDWIANIRARIDTLGCTPEYIIIQHAEPDHTGALRQLLTSPLLPDIRIVCTPKCGEMLQAFIEDIDLSPRLHTVADGDTLSLGETQLRFITAPMVHWPEVMMTLDTTHETLFSADAFGTFAMWNSTAEWEDEARRYYTNIVGRFGANVQAVMRKLRDLSFHTIAPLHGPQLTDHLPYYWELYDRWSTYTPETRGVLVAYASIYGGTAEAARRLCDLLRQAGETEVIPFDLCRHHVSYAVAQAFRLDRIVLATATYDGDLFPAMSTFLHHLAAKRLSGRTVGLIENGAWAPVAARLMADQLSKMRSMTILDPVVTIRGRLHSSDLPTLTALATALHEAK